MKQVSGSLRLELAQYRELAAFAQFGSDLDRDSKERIEKGQRLIEVLKQDQYSPMPVEEQVVILYAAVNNFLNDIAVENVRRFEKEFLQYVREQKSEILKAINEKKALDDELKSMLNSVIEEYKKIFK